jgi:hypothetical protein
MNATDRDRYKKKLHKYLAMAKDEEFVLLIWAINALQSNRADAVAGLLSYPPEAVTTDLASPYAIKKWEQETLVNQRLLVPAYEDKDGKPRTLNCQAFEAVIPLVNSLRKLENAESAMHLKRINIVQELHRIGHRQFPWQRGRLNISQLYRYAFIYGGPLCRNYFEQKNGLAINELSLVGFGYFASLSLRPSTPVHLPLNNLGVSADKVTAAIALLSTSIADGRTHLKAMIASLDSSRRGIAYQPSLIRKYPLILINGAKDACSPLPELILSRITSGLYYDLVAGGQPILNEASLQFERYSADFMQAMLPTLNVSGSHKYKVGVQEFETPDVLLRENGKATIVVECKATKLTFFAQFGDDPFEEARKGYEQIAKAVFQLWRYFSHSRRGILGDGGAAPDAHGIVLTLEPWLYVSRELYTSIVEEAQKLAQQDPDILEGDRRPVIFCSIEDLEQVLTIANAEHFKRSLSAACEERFFGWMLWNVNQEVMKELGSANERKAFPFKLGDVLPWWQQMAASFPSGTEAHAAGDLQEIIPPDI